MGPPDSLVIHVLFHFLQDWDYTAAGCMEITLELSQDKFPPASTLPQQWTDNLNSLLALPVAAVLGGVSGQVTDAAGVPIKGATVTVDGILMKSRARGPLAYFNKPLAPGSWTVRVQAPGYLAAAVAVTVPADGKGVRHDLKLVRSSRTVGRSATVVDEAAAHWQPSN
jgi:hypothetical protein